MVAIKFYLRYIFALNYCHRANYRGRGQPDIELYVARHGVVSLTALHWSDVSDSIQTSWFYALAFLALGGDGALIKTLRAQPRRLTSC